MSKLNTQLTGGMLMDVGDSLRGLAATGAVITYTLSGVQADQNGQFLGKILAQGQLGTVDGLIYAVPGAIAASIRMLLLANTSGVAVTGVAISVNGPAGTAANQIISSLTIPANGSALLSDGVLRVFDATGNLYQTATTPFDATIPAATTPLALGTVGTAVTAPHRDHTHQSPGGVASIVAASAGINTVETRIVGATVPAGLLKAGTIIEVIGYGTLVSTVDNVCTFNLRVGPVTLTGNIPAALAAHPGNSGTTTTAPFVLHAWITIRTAGAGGTAYGFGSVISRPTGAAVTQAFSEANQIFTPASVAVDTTVANEVELTFGSAGATSTATFQGAALSVVKM